MALFRVLFALLALACIACFGAYALTNDLRWRQRGVAILKWTMVSVAIFFAVLFAQQLWTLM